MKKILLSSLVVLSVLTSCSYSERIKNKEKCSSQKYSEPFKLINSGYDYDLVYDTETGIEYTVGNNHNGDANGVFVMLMTADGKPKLYNK